MAFFVVTGCACRGRGRGRGRVDAGSAGNFDGISIVIVRQNVTKAQFDHLHFDHQCVRSEGLVLADFGRSSNRCTPLDKSTVALPRASSDSQSNALSETCSPLFCTWSFWRTRYLCRIRGGWRVLSRKILNAVFCMD